MIWQLPYKRIERHAGERRLGDWTLVWLPIAKAKAETWRTRKYEYIFVGDLKPRLK